MRGESGRGMRGEGEEGGMRGERGRGKGTREVKRGWRLGLLGPGGHCRSCWNQ